MDKTRLIDNFASLKVAVRRAAIRSGKDPKNIRIIVASKYSDDINDLITLKDQGVEAFGENRIQSMLAKNKEALKHGAKLNWHFIGRLQTNKVKKAVEFADLIQSVDSIKLAETINNAASAMGKIQKVLVQLNVSGETSKTGFSIEEIENACQELQSLSNIRIEGLMTMAPLASSETVRPLFAKARETLTNLQSVYNIGSILSMGMTNDFETAIEEGSNMVRIGSAIWG